MDAHSPKIPLSKSPKAVKFADVDRPPLDRSSREQSYAKQAVVGPSEGSPRRNVSRNPSRRQGSVQPTSNPAAYAQNTDSHLKKRSSSQRDRHRKRVPTFSKASEDWEETGQERNRNIEEVEEDLRARNKELEVTRSDYEARLEILEEIIRGLENKLRERASDSEGNELAQKTKELEEARIENSKLREELGARPGVTTEELQEFHKNYKKQALTIQQLKKDIEEEKKLKEEQQQEEHVEYALATGTDTPSWHHVFRRLREIKTAQDAEIVDLKTKIKAVDTYLNDLEREATGLRHYVSEHRDTVQKLQLDLAKSRRGAKAWEQEYTQQKSMFDARDDAEDDELVSLHDELKQAASSYHEFLSSLSNPQALSVMDLTKKLEAKHQRALSDATSHINLLKQDKAELSEANDVLRKEIKKLKEGPPLPQQSVRDEETEEGESLPPWNIEQRKMERDATVAAMAKVREEARNIAERKEKMIDQARKWRIEKTLFPSPRDKERFEKLPKMEGWERWEGERWLDEQPDDSLNDEVERLGLRDEGNQKRGRRTSQWKGKRLQSMGLKNRDGEQD